MKYIRINNRGLDKSKIIRLSHDRVQVFFRQLYRLLKQVMMKVGFVSHSGLIINSKDRFTIPQFKHGA
jgi:hypothetical protein